MTGLTDKTIIITGASRGIGEATARHFATLGARVVLAARSGEAIAQIAEDIRSAGGQASALPCDVSGYSAVAALIDHAIAEFGGIDGLINNAAVIDPIARIAETDPEAWAMAVDINVKGVYYGLRAAIPAMLERGAGDLVLIGSIAGREVYPNGNVNCATKHAVHALYKALRIDAGATGVRFTTVDPGMVETEFSVVRFRGDTDAADRVYEGMQPLTPADVADAILYAVTRPPHVNIGEIVL